MNRRSITFCLGLFSTLVLCGAVVAKDDRGEADAESTWVTSIARLGQSDRFVAATADGLLLREASVCSFEASNPQQLQPLYSHPAAVWRVDATSDGATVASVDYRGNLIVYDTAASKPTTHEKAMERWCQAMLISPDDKFVVAGNEAGKVMVWDLAAANITHSVELDGHAVTGLAISPDGSQLAASDGAGHVHLLKWPSLEKAGQIQVGEQTAWCVAYTDGGENLLVGSSDRHLYRCEAKADAEAESIAKGTDWITQLAVSASGQVAAGEVGGRLHFPSTGGTDSMDATSGVWTLCWNGEAQLFAGTRKDGIVIASRSWKWTEPAPPKPAPEAAEATEQEPEGEEDQAAEDPEAEAGKADNDQPPTEKGGEEKNKDE